MCYRGSAAAEGTYESRIDISEPAPDDTNVSDLPIFQTLLRSFTKTASTFDHFNLLKLQMLNH